MYIWPGLMAMNHLLIPGVDSGMWLGHHKLKNTSSPVQRHSSQNWVRVLVCVCVSWVNISTKTKCLFLMIVWYSVSNSLWDLLARLSVSLVDQHASCVVARSPASQEEKIQFAVEALRRASAKFAGRQKVHVSNKFGFTKYTKKDGNALNCWKENFVIPTNVSELTILHA